MDAIVAVTDDWGIGSDGTQSIVLKADREFFSAMTKGAAIIVGRRTLEDFPCGKPLTYACGRGMGRFVPRHE